MATLRAKRGGHRHKERSDWVQVHGLLDARRVNGRPKGMIKPWDGEGEAFADLRRLQRKLGRVELMEASAVSPLSVVTDCLDCY